MRIEDFTVHFKKKKTVLYRFLLKWIRENTSYKGDKHLLIRELVALIYDLSYKKVLQGGLSKLSVESIIMVKARDSICALFRVPKKTLQFVEMTPAIYEQASQDLDPYQQLVLRQDMETLDTLLDDATRQMFENIADGVPSRETAENLHITLTALTSRISRARARIQKHLEEGY
jgi:hypothetical protein